jgi:hypothetical protein
MVRTNRTSTVAAYAACAWLYAATFLSTTAHAQLDADGVQCLQVMDSASVAQVLELTRQVATWRQTMQDARRVIELASQATSGGAVNAEAEKAAAQLVAIAQDLQRQQQLLQRFIPAAGIDRLQRQIDATGTRAEIGKRVAAAKELVAELDRIVEEIQKLREPAQFAKSFVEEKIEGQLGKPQKWGDDLTFVIEKSDPTKSVFSDQADIRITVQYQSAFSLSATGLFFKYTGSGVAEPCFDKIVADEEGLKNQLVTKGLTCLGDIIPEDLDLPIKVENVHFLGFAASGPKQRRCGVSLDVKIKFADSLPELSGKDVVIYPTGSPDVGELGTGDPKFKFKLGTTGLGLYGYHVSWDFKDNTLKGRTYISTWPGEPKAYRLDVTVSVKFPLDYLELNGKLELADGTGRTICLAEVSECRLDFTNGSISGRFAIPGSPKQGQETLPISSVLTSVNGEFDLDREGFWVKGEMSLLGENGIDVELDLLFNGNGRLVARSGFNVLGVNASASVNAGFEPGFSRIWLSAKVSVVVNTDYLNKSLGDISCTVEVVLDTGRKEILAVHTRAFDVPISFSVRDFRELTLDKLANEIGSQAAQQWHEILDKAAEREKDIRKGGAAAEKRLRDWLADRDPTPKLGGPLGGLGADLAGFGKDLAGGLHDFSTGVGGALSHGRESVNEGLKNFESAIRDPVESLGFGLVGETADYAPTGFDAGTVPDVLARLDRFSQGLDRLEGIHDQTVEHRVTRGRRYSRDSQLHVHFLSNSAGMDNPSDVGFALLIEVSGYQVDITHGDSEIKEPNPAGHVYKVQIVIKGLMDGGQRPVATIDIPPLDHDSVFPAEQLVRERLQRLLEYHFPEVEVEGEKRFFEKRLAIENRHDEPVTVWVQRRTFVRAAEQRGWQWVPAECNAAGAKQIKIAPGKTELLEETTTLRLPAFSKVGGFPRLSFQKKEIAVPLTASRMRIWAESESGERWTDDKAKSVYLIEPNAALNGERAYVEKDMKTYTYVISPHTGSHVFTERQLALQNKTHEDLTVDLVCRTTQGNNQRWLRLPGVSIKAGETLEPRQDDGFRIRASRVYFVAHSESFRYLAYKREPLWLVDETAAGRVYGQEKIGRFTHVFDVANANRN